MNVDALIQTGLTQFNQGNLEQAESAFIEILRAQPQEPNACNLLGLLRKAQGRFKEAEALHRRAIQAIPQAGGFHNNLGTALRLQGRVPEAIEAYRSAIRSEPANGDFHLNLGRLLWLSGEFRAALEAIEAGVLAAPRDAELTAYRSEMLEQFRNGQQATNLLPMDVLPQQHMVLLIYSQIGFMGGSLRLLLNLGKFLSTEHQVVILAPNLDLQDEPGLDKFQNLRWLDSSNPTLDIPKADIAILHLPSGMDKLSRQISCFKILVVFEIMKLHPFQIEKEDSKNINRVIYLHREQEESLFKIFEKKRCTQLPIVNSIDFELPFIKTGYSASIGAGIHKHNLFSILKILYENRTIEKHIIYISKLAEPEARLELNRLLILIPIKQKMLSFSGIEWDVRKIYSSFDCLLHFPREGNGTSMVVSEALSCGKLVILAPLPAYKEAYSGMTGVHFPDAADFDLPTLLRNYNQDISEKIREDYNNVYNRDFVLSQWKIIITGVQ